MANATSSQHRIDQFFSGPGARADQWRDILDTARSWHAGKAKRADFEAALAELATIEEFHAYPGARLMGALRDTAAADDARSTAALVHRITIALLTRSFRHHAEDWDVHGDLGEAVPDVLPPALGRGEAHRPYFETLIVTGAPTERWPTLCAEWRRLRRPLDQFVYEPVIVGSVEDAFCAIMLNADLAAVVINEGFVLRSRHDAPVLRTLTASMEQGSAEMSALQLAQLLKRVRPELDIYLVSDRKVEEIAGDPQACVARRVFYFVEELLELHLAILEGVQERFETPFFDNLKKYAQRPIGTFHALPIARGKSIFKSDWIRDMGEFYGPNLFLAESSATTGGLDSLLEPTGNIKKAQENAARAFGADHVFFVTNGTSTSNKMAVQALLGPGDIAIVDRNCHKSHHYGMVLAGAQPLYVEAFPMTEYSMYGAVPLRTIKQALLNLKAEGRLHKAKMVDLTNCTFDGHIYNTRRVMEECLAIKPDLIFLWDEAWFGFARFSPFLRPRTAMGAANDIEAWLHDPASVTTYDKQRAELGDNPSDETLLNTRLIPDPRQVKLRVYQTNSTHKSMSALRQGSMLLVKDVEFHTVEAQFHEAVFTHASTSPNQQLIASLDVARRQMELEGYGLVSNAIEVAMAIRQAVNGHPRISKYFQVLGADKMVPTEFRKSGFVDFLSPGANWATALKSVQEDEFCLDPTRMTLVCGTAGYDGTQFKGLLASRYNIQLNKTSRNSVLLQSNINNTRSDVAHLIRVLVEISSEIDERLAQGGANVREAFEARVRSLMTDVPDLPNFSYFHDAFRGDAGSRTNEGDIRGGFYSAYDAAGCEYIRLHDPEIDRRLKNGPELVSSNFVIPYPPGFPIMVPGQVITQETIDFMRKLDVKEIHGYEASQGLKLVRPEALAKISGKAIGSSGGRRAAKESALSGAAKIKIAELREAQMKSFFAFLQENPYLLLFLVVGVSVWIGRFTIKGYGLGMVAGAIVVGCAISVAASVYGVKLELNSFVKSLFYYLFMYGVGLRVGPSFINSLKGDGLKFTFLAVVASVLGLTLVVTGAKLFDLPVGAAGGMLAGSQTMSAAIGSAEQAVTSGAVKLPPGVSANDASAMIALSYGITYIWGTVGIILICKYLPRWWGVDARKAAKEYEAEHGVKDIEGGGLTGYRPFGLRAYRLENPSTAGQSIADFRRFHPEYRIANVVRNGESLGASPTLVMQKGDVIALGGPTSALTDKMGLIGPEVADETALKVPLDQADILVTNKDSVGRELESFRQEPLAGQVQLVGYERGGVPFPAGLKTTLQRMDILTVVGLKPAVQEIGARLGRIARANTATDLLTLSAGMILGFLIGLIQFPAFGAKVGLGNAGGLLLSGVIVSSIVSRLRFFGNTPNAARNILEDLGLVVFVGIVGLNAGGSLLAQLTGAVALKIFVVGFIACTIPPFIVWAIGFHIFKINPAVLMGGVAGARSHSGPCREAAVEIGSTVPWIGFPVGYAVSGILLTVFGYFAMLLAQ